MSLQEHQSRPSVARCAILTVSDTRTSATDGSGDMAAELLGRAGHEVALREVVPNDPSRIRAAAEKALRDHDLLLAIGGTGVGRKDLTVDALRPLSERELPGFGELFRSLSAREIGTAAILSRAFLGTTASGKVVVALPGSKGAVRLAVEGILVPELGHLLGELRRHP